MKLLFWLLHFWAGWRGDRLMKLIAAAMDLDEHFFQPFFTDPIIVLRGHYYTPVRSDPSQGVFAAGKGHATGFLCYCVFLVKYRKVHFFF